MYIETDYNITYNIYMCIYIYTIGMSSKIHGLSMFISDLSSFTKDAICGVSTIIRQAHSCFGCTLVVSHMKPWFESSSRSHKFREHPRNWSLDDF